MALLGVALLPEVETSRSLIDFQNQELNVFHAPKLSLNGFLPHTSILQCPFKADALNADFMDRVAQIWHRHAHNSSIFTDLYIQPTGWFFLGVERLLWLESFQRDLLELMEPEIDTTQITVKDGFDNYTPTEQNNFLRYGYRYVGQEFRPHVTLGHDTSFTGALPSDLLQRAHSRFTGKSCVFDKVVFYEAGPHGALAKVLQMADFKP